MTGWDGCYRFNPEKQDGLLFFYRNGSLTECMTFPVPMTEESAVYKISRPDGSVVGTFGGKELQESGLRISLPEKFSAEILEIEKM